MYTLFFFGSLRFSSMKRSALSAVSPAAQLLQYTVPLRPQNTLFSVSQYTPSTFEYDCFMMSTPSTKPSNRAVAPSRAASVVASYSSIIACPFATTAWAFTVASLVSFVISMTWAVALSAFAVAVSAFPAAFEASVAAAAAWAAASVAGFCSSDMGALTTSSPLMAGSEVMPSRLVTCSSSSTPCDSLFIALISSCFSSVVSAIVVCLFIVIC